MMAMRRMTIGRRFTSLCLPSVAGEGIVSELPGGGNGVHSHESAGGVEHFEEIDFKKIVRLH